MTTRDAISFVCGFCHKRVVAVEHDTLSDTQLAHWFECDVLCDDDHKADYNAIFAEDGVIEHYWVHLAGIEPPIVEEEDEVIINVPADEPEPTPEPTPEPDKPETIFICEYCDDWSTTSKIGLHSHVTHKHQAEILDMHSLIQEAKDAIQEAELTSEEIEQQSKIDAEMWGEVKELRKLVTSLEALRDEHLALEPEYHDVAKLAKWAIQIDAYNAAIDARCTMIEVQRGRKVYNRVALADKREENQLEADKRNAEQARTVEWEQEEILRYHNLLTGRTWCHTNSDAWNGAMPFIVDFCWRVTNFAKKEKCPISYPKMKEKGIYDRAFDFTMKRYGFVQHHTERVRAEHWFVDDDAELDSETFTQEIDCELPFEKWQSELERLDKKYRTFWYKEDAINLTIDWAEKNGLYGSGDHDIVFPSNVKVRKVKREHDTNMGHAFADAGLANNGQRHDPKAEENNIK